ncbi:hypothetical protein FDZ71_10935 [bacterium]|nr:MAG: hypothetical protein FDZ71_10935 [bacterium]
MTAANISTVAVATEMTDSVVGVDGSGMLIPFRGFAGDGEADIARAASSARRIAAVIRSSSRSAAETIPGDYSGYCEITATGSETAFEGSITFYDYSDSLYSDSLSGSISFSYRLASGNEMEGTEQLQISFTNLTSGSERVYGSLGLTHQYVCAAVAGDETYYKDNVAMDMTYAHNSTTNGGPYAVAYDNLAYEEEWSGLSGTTVTSIDGRIYHSDYGFVDIVTEVPRVYYEYSYNYGSGLIYITGAGSAKVKLEYSTSGNVAYLDADGNGTYDYQWGLP